MTERKIPFSPPDISELEIAEVAETLRSGWITTGPRTKLLERRLAAYIETGRTDVDCESEENASRFANRVVCLNSATAAEEMNFRILGIGPGDEVIVPAYTYTASASAAIHCGATVKLIDIQKDGDIVSHMPEMDYHSLEDENFNKIKKKKVPARFLNRPLYKEHLEELRWELNLLRPDGKMYGIPTLAKYLRKCGYSVSDSKKDRKNNGKHYRIITVDETNSGAFL